MWKKNVIGSVIALLLVIGFLSVMGLLAIGWVVINPDSKEFFNISLGALISFTGLSINYFLGSSKGSADKNELMGLKPPEPPAG